MNPDGSAAIKKVPQNIEVVEITDNDEPSKDIENISSNLEGIEVKSSPTKSLSTAEGEEVSQDVDVDMEDPDAEVNNQPETAANIDDTRRASVLTISEE